MRDLLDDIQALIEKGVTRKLIYDNLQKNGFKMTYESFLVTLKRIRKEKRDLAVLTPTESSSQSGSVVNSISSSHNTSQPNAAKQTNRGHDPPSPNSATGTLIRPKGITPVAWAEMQQKHRETQRRQQNQKGITK